MVFIVIAQLIILFLLSRSLTIELSRLFYSIFKSHRISVWILAILFLPGTIIHEFSHAIMAKALFVYVGKMNLIPQLEGESLKLGSVEIGKTDIFRNFLIGIAPFLVGTALLLMTLYSVVSSHLLGFNIFTFLFLLFIFILSNTMYSSKKDMEGAVEFLLAVIVPAIVLYMVGIRIPMVPIDLNSYFQVAAMLLAVPLVLDVALIVFAKVVRGN